MIHPCRGVQGEVPSGQYLSLSCRFNISKIFKKKIHKVTIRCIETSNAFSYFDYHLFLDHRAGYSMKGSNNSYIDILIFWPFYSHLFLNHRAGYYMKDLAYLTCQ